MAGKKTTTKKNTQQVEIGPAVETVKEEIKETKNLVNELETEITKQIEKVSENVAEQVAEVKAQEADIMAKIEANPNEAKVLIEEEVERVDEALNNLTEKIEKLADGINKNKVVFTTTTWNGWGYNG